MGGFFRGAILGLGCGVIALTVVAMVFPSVDPAKYSEAPDAVSEEKDPILPPEVEAEENGDNAEDQTLGAEGAPAVPQAPSVEDAEVAPVIDAAPLDRAPQEDAPKAVETPAQQEAPDVEADADTEVDVKKVDTTAPSSIAEDGARVVTKEAEAVEIAVPSTPIVEPTQDIAAPVVRAEADSPSMPEAPEIMESPESSVSPESAEVDTESVPQERVQSDAEAGSEPPTVLEETPDAPRAIVKRPVDSESFGKPVGNFIENEHRQTTLVPTVRTNRLPRISSGESAETEVSVANPQTPHALRDNGVPFNASGKPLIGVLVIEGQERTQDDARLDLVQTFDLPLTIGMDPLSEGAAERARAYSDAGADIVIFSSLPAGSTPQDIETTLADYQRTLPMAVAVMDAPRVDPNSPPPRLNRVTLQHVTAILRDTGLGLVAKQKGLNAAIQLAKKHSVPNVQIYYNISEEETQDRLRTIFNRAVFRATQKGASVLTIPGNVSSLTAFQAWALVDRPSSIQMAPVSAILLGVDPQ